MRIFVAIDLSTSAKKEIEKLYKKVLERKHWSVKWERPEKLHLTLAFLGELNKEFRISQIKRLIEKAIKDISPFKVSFKGLGCFPGYDWPRIIWLGLKGDLTSLAKLQKNICRELLSYYQSPTNEVENKIVTGLRRPFSGHITLGRVRDCRGAERKEIGRQLKNLRILTFKTQLLVDRVVIYESQCLSQGSVYHKLIEIKFKQK